jgi:hypothetical protein
MKSKLLHCISREGTVEMKHPSSIEVLSLPSVLPIVYLPFTRNHYRSSLTKADIVIKQTVSLTNGSARVILS